MKELEMLKALDPLKEIYDDMPSLGSHGYSTNSGVIAFCGKAYPFYSIKDQHCYTFDKIRETIYKLPKIPGSLYRDDLLACINSEDRAIRWKYHGMYAKRWWHGQLNLVNWTDFCDNVNLTVPDSLHLYFKSPVIVKFEDYILLNPLLKDYNFATQVDPFQAFQELSMYVGNNLATQMDPEVHISDKIRAESKGFDKWSFRTHPSDSKKKKK